MFIVGSRAVTKQFLQENGHSCATRVHSMCFSRRVASAVVHASWAVIKLDCCHRTVLQLRMFAASAAKMCKHQGWQSEAVAPCVVTAWQTHTQAPKEAVTYSWPSDQSFGDRGPKDSPLECALMETECMGWRWSWNRSWIIETECPRHKCRFSYLTWQHRELILTAASEMNPQHSAYHFHYG